MKVDDIKKLQQKKYRQQWGYYLVEGEHLILELIKVLPRLPHAEHIHLYVTAAHATWAASPSCPLPFTVVSDKHMLQMSDTKTPQGLVAVVPLPSLLSASQSTANERCIYLHEIQDPGNLGTILRSLAWFGGFRLLLSPQSVDPFNAKVIRASMGAIFHVPIEAEVSLAALSQRFSDFAYLDIRGSSIREEAFQHYPCYLFGNEARGIPTDILQTYQAQAFTIAGTHDIDSLNLANAVSICAYQLSG